MKTLSIQQPWASLVCAGIKDVENRTWKPADVPGRILIHASSKKVTKNFFASIPEYLVSFINNDIGFGNLPELDTLPTSAIIGYVTVTGFEEGEVDSIWSDGPGVIKWKLEDAWLFDEPILNVKGKLNLFDYDEIDENNLPPAHQVELADVDLNDAEDEIYIPCVKNTFEGIKAGKFEGIELNLTDYLMDVLCVEDEFKMKPFKTVIVGCGNQCMRFELAEDSGIYNIPDPQDETKPYMIYYPDGAECAWMVAQFTFGKKLDEGEAVEICGGLIHDLTSELGKAVINNEKKDVIKFNVSKEVFNDIVNGKQGVFEKEIKPNKLRLYFKTDEKGDVIIIDGVPQFRRYDAIQFTNKDNTYTCQINNADLLFLKDPSYGMVSYSELEEDEIDCTEGVIAYSLGEEIK